MSYPKNVCEFNMKIFDVSKKLSVEILQGHFEDLKLQFGCDIDGAVYQGISLSGLALTKDNIAYYHKALKHLEFTHLQLSLCKIDDEVLPLVLSMANDLGIKHLDLSANLLTKNGYLFLFQNLGKVRKLSLRSNKLNDDLFESFASHINASRLQHLDLRNNQLGHHAFLTLSDILKQSEQLISIWLLGNLPTRKGLNDFVEQLKHTNIFLTDIDKMFMTGPKPETDLIASLAKPIIRLHAFTRKLSLEDKLASLSLENTADDDLTSKKRYSV